MLNVKNLLMFQLLILAIGCDSIPRYVEAKQSINNMSSDTIIIFNSLKEYRGIDVDTIICLPDSESVFFNCTLHYQPLEPYNTPIIREGSVIYTNSGRKLVKIFFDDESWDFIINSKQEWLIFTITESDLE